MSVPFLAGPWCMSRPQTGYAQAMQKLSLGHSANCRNLAGNRPDEKTAPDACTSSVRTTAEFNRWILNLSSRTELDSDVVID